MFFLSSFLVISVFVFVLGFFFCNFERENHKSKIFVFVNSMFVFVLGFGFVFVILKGKI